jgi:hypothetical protein
MGVLGAISTFDIIDENILNNLDKISQKLVTNAIFSEIAVPLCAVFAIISIGWKLIPMIAGHKKLDVFPLLRPFFIYVMILAYGGVLSSINKVSTGMANHVKDKWETVYEEIPVNRQIRAQLMDSCFVRMMEVVEEMQRAKDVDGGFAEKAAGIIGIDFDAIAREIAQFSYWVEFKIKWAIMWLIEKIAIFIFQCMVYWVRFLQVFFLAILAAFCPICLALSILPAFQDTWKHWLAKYVSVSLYACISYVILFVAYSIMNYGLETEIGYLQHALKTDTFYAWLASWYAAPDFITFIVSAVVGGISMLAVPQIATWIIQVSSGQLENSAVGAPVRAAVTAVGTTVGILAGAAVASGAAAGKAAGGGGSSAGGGATP